MSVRLIMVVALSVSALAGCGSASRGDAKAPEADPWAGYKGTYATAAGASGTPATRLKAAHPAPAKELAVEAAAPSQSAAPTPSPISTATTAAKKAKPAASKSSPSKKAKR